MLFTGPVPLCGRELGVRTACLNQFPSSAVLDDSSDGHCFSCLAQLSNCRKEGVINQWAVDSPLPNKGMKRTTGALTTKEQVKMESHKKRERQMEVAPGELCQRDISCLHFFFKGTIFQFLLPELSEMPGLSARASWRASQPALQMPEEHKHSHLEQLA